MVIVQSYPLAVVMCVITMLCWGSWANTQKLATKEWRFQLFYWDYAIGVLLLALLLAFTLGSTAAAGEASWPISSKPTPSGSARRSWAESSSTCPTSCWWRP